MHLSTYLSEEPNRFLPLLLVVLLAFLVPIVLARFRRVPVVVGEILAGIVIGPSLLGIVGEDAILRFMADIGLAFLIFLAGMEIDLARLFPARNGPRRRDGPNVLGMALALYALTVALAIPGGFLITGQGATGDPWLMAFVLSAVSLGVLLPILKERGMLNSLFGQLVFLTALLADFLTVILLTIYVLLLEQGLNLQIFSLGLLFLAFLIFYRVGPSFVRIPAVRTFFDELSHATVQLKVRGAIAILITFVVLAEFVGAELILGAFLAGMIITLLRAPEDDALVEKLEAFGFGFFIPVFFIMVGVQIDLKSLLATPEALLLLPVLFVAALVIKLIPMLATRRWFTAREMLAAGVLLNTHLSLEVAIAVVGLRTGLFDAATSTNVILFAILTVVTMPVLFNAIMPHIQQRRRRLVVAVGVNDLGLKVAAELRGHGDEVSFLENDGAGIQRAESAGFAVIQGPADGSGLAQLPAGQVETLLALQEDDRLNRAIAARAKEMQVPNVVALVEDPARLAEFVSLGVQPFVNALHRATMIAMMARNPDTYALLTSTTDQRDIAEVRVRNSFLVGRRLRDLQLPGDYLVLSIRRGSELLIPHGNTMLEFNDRLSLLGDLARLDEARSMLEGGFVSAEPTR
jgi:Kef-type K+ transport system membrane component KefB